MSLGEGSMRGVHAATHTSHAPQVEVKIRLPDRASYDSVTQLLSSGLQATHEQENFFFDGSNKELNSQRAVLRLRFYDVDKKAVITVKVQMFPCYCHGCPLLNLQALCHERATGKANPGERHRASIGGRGGGGSHFCQEVSRAAFLAAARLATA